jgi:dolichyl-phosphate-mannose-protein mannosyltransferase
LEKSVQNRNFDPQDSDAAIAPLKSWLIVLVCAEGLAFLLLLHFLRDSKYIQLYSLGAEYGVLLPSLIWLLRSCGGGKVELPLKWAALTIVLLFFVVCAALSRHEYDYLANQVDESCYRFQARIFRSGRLVAEPLPGASRDVRETPAELDYQNHVLTTRGWFTHFPPGWPLLLAMGQGLGLAWLLNPILGVILLATIWLIGRDAFSAGTGHLAVIFAAVSPFMLVNSARQLSHTLSAALGAAACWCLLRGLSSRKASWFAATFGLLALAFQVRPYTALAQSVVLGASALWYTRSERKFFWTVLTIGLVFAGLAAALNMLYYRATTGSLLVSPYAARVGAKLPSEITFNPQSLLRFLYHFGPTTLENSLFGTFPFLFVLGLYALLRETKRIHEVRILAAFFAAVVVAYVFHTENSYSFYGSRFHFEGFFAAVLIGARGLELLSKRCPLPRFIWGAILAMLILASVSKEIGAVREIVRLGKSYSAVRKAAQESTAPVVFLHSGAGFNPRFMNLNEADWRHARTVYLIDAEPEKRAQWACQLGRRRWQTLYPDGPRVPLLEPGETTCEGGAEH